MVVKLDAIDWIYNSDLNFPPARWSCTFLESGSTRFLPGENLPKSGLDRAEIRVTVDGATERLTEGIVREWGIAEDEDSSISTAAGVDLKGILLDFFPSEAVAYRGMEVLSNSTSPIPSGARRTAILGSDSAGRDIKAAYFESFQRAAADIVDRAGYAASFDCYDYQLGTDIIWDPAQSANEMLAQLATPFNATERFKLDIFIEGTTVRFVERGRSTPPQVTAKYDTLTPRTVRRSVFAPFNDVQVRGATYRFVEPDVGNVIVEGLTRPTPYTLAYRTVEEEAGEGQVMGSPYAVDLQPIVVAVTEGTRYFDAQGRKLRDSAVKQYSIQVLRNEDTGLFVATVSRVRREDTTEEWIYDDDLSPRGEPVRQVKMVFVEDFSTEYKPNSSGNPVATGKTFNVAQYVARDEILWLYDAAGDPLYQSEKTYRATEPDPGKAATGLVLERHVESYWWWSNGQRWRSVATRNFDRSKPGRPSTISTHTEPATGRGEPQATLFWRNTPDGVVGIWEAGNIHPAPPAAFQSAATAHGLRQGTEQIKSGPDSAQIVMHFPLVGHPDDVEYFRGRIKTERKSARYEATLGMLPNLSVREGMDLTVSGAPSRWERSTFFVIRRNIAHNPDLLNESVSGLAWIDL